MQTIIYDGSFEGFLCAVFDVYEYKFQEVDICLAERFKGNVFNEVHHARTDTAHSDRVWKGLKKIISPEAENQLYHTFLSEIEGIEIVMLRYIQYAFQFNRFGMENDFSNDAVLTVKQTSRKVWREKHRMEAFVRFQKTADDLFYSIIEPDYNVLPLIAKHFEKRYADQKWMVYDAKRSYGIFYDLKSVNEITANFSPESGSGKDISAFYEEKEELYQQLWQQYFKSVNIAARKNSKLHLQHMPSRYWKYLTEKAIGR